MIDTNEGNARAALLESDLERQPSPTFRAALHDQLECHLEALVGDGMYSGTFERFQKHQHERHREGLTLTVWESADGSPQSYRDLCSGFRDCKTRTRWYLFTDPPQPTTPEIHWFGAVEVITRPHKFPLDSESYITATDMENFQADSAWPDVVILTRRLLSRICADRKCLTAWLDNFYHFVEPGGIFFVLDELGNDAVEAFMNENGGKKANGLWSLKKDPNIYESTRRKVANRNRIFDDETCKDSAIRTMKKLRLPSGAKILDVGTGDGRFSKYMSHYYSQADWKYEGLEMSPHAAMNPNCPDLKGKIRKGNFFDLESNWIAVLPDPAGSAASMNSAPTAVDETHAGPNGDYSAVLFFFVLHSFKFWQLYIFRAYEVLQQGGYLALAFRDDNFSYWLHGEFSDQVNSPVKDAMHRYWQERYRLGIRNSDQMNNVISPVQSLHMAEELGFKFERVVRVTKVREYEILRRDFCPAEDEPACWNIARVGVTKQDERALANAFRPESVQDTLHETMVVYLLKKQ